MWSKIRQFFTKKSVPTIDMEKFPHHIGIIMDGNGRWAEHRYLPVSLGHRQGGINLEQLVKDILHAKLPLQSLTVYAFSTENWQRSPEEVGYLMQLFEQYLDRDLNKLVKSGVQIRVIGARNQQVPDSLLQKIKKLEAIEVLNPALILNVAFNYGGRTEIVEAAQRLLQELPPEQLTIENLSKYMYNPDLNNIDLIIRTGHYQRLSNFLLWQAAYAELYFTDTFWPDFKLADLLQAVQHFQAQKRNFGRRKTTPIL